MIELVAGVVTIGAILQRNFNMSVFAIVSIAAVGCCILLVRFGTKHSLFFSSVLIISCVSGALLIQHAHTTTPRSVFGTRTFQARVLFVDRRLTKTNLIVRDQLSGKKIQLGILQQISLLPGDTIKVYASIEMPEIFETTTGRMFDYPNYLKSKGIAGLAKNAQVEIVERGQLMLNRVATILRFRIADIFARYLAFPIDGVVAGMTVGYQGGIPDTIQDLFRNTGVLHVLVLSGYNITLLAGFLAVILRFLPNKIRITCTVATIVLLVLISGSGVASVRAGIMGSIALTYNFVGKRYHPLQALAVSYIFFFILSPLMVFYDPGFHLSFLATAFMVLALPKIERLFLFLPETKVVDIRELLMLAFSAPLFMVPYTMYFSGNFPLASPVANIIMAIVTPVFSIMAFFILFCSWIPPLAAIVGALLSYMGKVVIYLLELSSMLPIWNAPAIRWWLVLGCYALLFWLLLKREVSQYFLQLRNYLQQPSSPFEQKNH